MEIRFFDREIEGSGKGILLLIFRKWKSFFRVAIGEKGDWLWHIIDKDGRKVTYFFAIEKTEAKDTKGWAVFIGPLCFVYYGYKK